MIRCRIVVAATVLCAVAAGCVPYARVEMALVDQARKGIANSKQHRAAEAALVEKVHELRAQALDDAFDEDVREQAALTPDWVIEHRRAYAAALAAITDERERLLKAQDVDARNLSAVDAAMARLRWMQSAEVNWFDQLEGNP